jgi:hypothetical protein
LHFRQFSDSAAPAFRIGAAGTDILCDPAPWAARFAAERAIVCRDIFEPALLDRIRAAARCTQFRIDRISGLGTRQAEAPQRVGGILNLLLQRTNLFRWLEAVTGHSDISLAEGRLHQTCAGAGEGLDWHDDLIDPCRVLGITINFTEAIYSGGRFELRTPAAPDEIWAFDHNRLGTALIFDIGRDLEHRLLPVVSGGPRRVFAGWFIRAAAPLV